MRKTRTDMLNMRTMNLTLIKRERSAHNNMKEYLFVIFA